MVLIDNEKERNQWKIAKIVDCIKSNDGHVRSVKVMLGNENGPTKSERYLIQPVTKLVVLVEGARK